MKKLIFYLCMVIPAILLLFTGIASAQEPEVPCLDEFCPESQFPFTTATATVNLDIYGTCGTNCEAVVTYKHRKACGQVCDVYIEEVAFVDPTKCSCGNGLEGMRAAIAALLVSDDPNLQGCLPSEDDCVPVFRVTLGGCYRLRYNDIYHAWSGYVSCGAHICCLGDYEICRDENGDLSFTQTSGNEPVLPCSALPPNPSPDVCHQYCEALPSSSPPAQSKIAIGNPTLPSYQFSGQDIELYPNPASGVVVVRCDGGEKEHGVLEISAMSGELVRRDNLERDTEGKLGAELDLSELPSGSYGYRVIADGKPLCSGVLTVAR